MGIIEGSENLIFREAIQHFHWRQAMHEKYESILQNKTWSLVDLPYGKKPMTAHWIFKVKPSLNISFVLYKAWFVARGFQQCHGIDYEETFAPKVRRELIWIIIAISTHNNWQIHHMDVQTMSLNGYLTVELYLEQPKGFVQPNHEHQVCKLHRALCGLKQSPWEWYS